MKIESLSFLILIILFASCDKYSRDKYPQLVSTSERYQYINSKRYNKEGNGLLTSKYTVSFIHGEHSAEVEFEIVKMEYSWKLGNKFKLIKEEKTPPNNMQ